ncbi:MAG: phosphotransacetylase family protein, partial [Mycetocola sp.]
MAQSIYITSAEGHTGKSTIVLGLLDAVGRTSPRVGVFRPVSRSSDRRDYVLELLLEHASLDQGYEESIGVSYEEVHEDPERALANIVERFQALQSRFDVVIVIGSDYTDVGSPTELRFNARVAANLGAPVLLVLGGRLHQGAEEQLGRSLPRSAEDLRHLTEVALAELRGEHAELLAVIANRADPEQLSGITESIATALADDAPDAPVWVIPEDEVLISPTVQSVLESVDGTLVSGEPSLLSREALGVVVSAMSMENVLDRLLDGAIVVVPADRSEVLLAVLLAQKSETFPSISGIVVNGGFPLPSSVSRLLDGLDSNLPVITTPYGSYETAVRIMRTRGRLAADSQRKYDTALALFETHVDVPALVDRLQLSGTEVVTPLMLEYRLIERARSARKHIVLPEGEDDRILRAAHTVLARGIADLTILGEEIEVRARAIELGLDLKGATVVSPFDPVLRLRFAEEYQRLRAHKGVTLEQAMETVTDVSYFGTM